MDISITIGIVCLYFLIGIFIAFLLDEVDGEHLIGYAIFWPLIALLFVVALLVAISIAIVDALYKIILKK